MLYFVGGCLSYIETEIPGASVKGSWLPVSNTLAITAVSPFVGYLQDLLGRRNITLAGSIIIMAGIALIGSAHSFGQAVGGMALSGAGAGICELTSLAGYTEHRNAFLFEILYLLTEPQNLRCSSGETPWTLISFNDSLHFAIHALCHVQVRIECNRVTVLEADCLEVNF